MKWRDHLCFDGVTDATEWQWHLYACMMNLTFACDMDELHDVFCYFLVQFDLGIFDKKLLIYPSYFLDVTKNLLSLPVTG